MSTILRHGILDYKIELPVGAEKDYIVKIYTNAYDENFVAALGITGGGTLDWDFGDDTSISANDVDHTYSSPGNKIVTVTKGTTSGADAISSIDIGDTSVYGTLDLSDFTSLTGILWFDKTPELTTVLLPPQGSNCGCSNFNATKAGIEGVLDMRGFSTLPENYFYAYLCPNLTNILFNGDNSHTSSMNNFWVSNCNITGIFDVSCYTGISGVFNIQNNTNLCEIILPDVLTQQFTSFDADDCSLSQTSVDAIFSKMNTYFSSNSPTANLAVDVHGGTNMPPTDGASNADIVSLTSIFTGAGRTFSANINT